MTPIELIKSKCVMSGDCWLWQGCLTSTLHPGLPGYPKRRYIARIVWELDRGIQHDDDERVVRSCASFSCVSPSHLYLMDVIQARRIPDTVRPTILRLKRSGMSGAELASRYMCHQTTIYRIIGQITDPVE